MTEAKEQEFAELLGFLQDKKIEVQRFAAEGVLELTEDEAFVTYVQKHPRAAARPLLRVAEKAEADSALSTAAAATAASSRTPQGEKAAKMAAIDSGNSMAAGSAALQALVNISAMPSVRDELVELSAPRRIAETLRSGWLEGRASLAHWQSMLLANITTGKVGQEALCSDEALLRFILAAYSAKPRPAPRDGYEDPLLCLGKVLSNVCVLAEGRRIMAIGEQGPSNLRVLLDQMSDRARRADMVAALKNLSIDKDCHPAVLSTDFLRSTSTFLYPLEKVSQEVRLALPEELRKYLEQEGAALTGDVSVRGAAASSFLGLCRSLEGREYLRSNCCCEILSAWQKEETEEDVRVALEVTLSTLRVSETELQEQLSKQAAEVVTPSPVVSRPESQATVPQVPAAAAAAPRPPAKPDDGKEENLKDIFDGIEESCSSAN